MLKLRVYSCTGQENTPQSAHHLLSPPPTPECRCGSRGAQSRVLKRQELVDRDNELASTSGRPANRYGDGARVGNPRWRDHGVTHAVMPETMECALRPWSAHACGQPAVRLARPPRGDGGREGEGKRGMREGREREGVCEREEMRERERREKERERERER